MAPLLTREPAPVPSKSRLLGELEHPMDAVANIGPNWFASVMGSGIVANAAALLPVKVTGLHTAALIVWLLAASLLVSRAARAPVR